MPADHTYIRTTGATISQRPICTLTKCSGARGVPGLGCRDRRSAHLTDRYAVIASLIAGDPLAPDYYASRLSEHAEYVHVTIEVHRCEHRHPELRAAGSFRSYKAETVFEDCYTVTNDLYIIVLRNLQP